VDASTLVVIFLLVTAASLASYLLSQWSSIRNGDMRFGWIAISSIGTTFLLVAAAMVVLTLGLLPMPRLLSNNEPAEQMRKSPESGRGTADRVLDRQEASTAASDATTRPVAPTDHGASPAEGRYITEGNSEHRSEIDAASALSLLQRPGESGKGRSGAAPHGVGLVFAETDPWAATNCVYAFNPDPADLTRWTIENECGAPVGLVFASCSKSPPECSGPQSTSWEYQVDGMMLPGKARRPVTSEEETRYGLQIRYVACMVATPAAIELIGQRSETRSSPSWSQQFDAARNSDPCLTRVQQWSRAGRGSGKSIDVLLGPNAPGKPHPAPPSKP
jgi:hypothetical protein